MTESWRRLSFVGGEAETDDVRLHLSTDSVAIDSRFGSTVIEDSDLCRVGSGSVAWLSPHASALLIVAQVANVLYSIILRTGHVIKEVLLRDDEPDLRFLDFSSIADNSSLLVVYERGLLRIDEDGAVRWHRLHDDLSAQIAEVSQDEVVLETQWPTERAGRRVRYRLHDGQELPESS